MTAIVIIGAGECGVRATFAIREEGFDGTVTLIGAETGLSYERPPLSKDPNAAPRPIQPEAVYAERGIDLRLGTRVSRVDAAGRSAELGNGTTLG